MSKILNTDFFLGQELSGDHMKSHFSCNNKSQQSVLYAMDDCTHLDFSDSSKFYTMDDCTNLEFSVDEKCLQTYVMDDCVNLSF